MNVLNVPDLERELSLMAARARYPEIKRWVMTVARNHFIGHLPEKDIVANFCEFTLDPEKKTDPGYYYVEDASILPEWVSNAHIRGDKLFWFDPVGTRRREIWKVLEIILIWLNNWKSDDTRLRRLDRISFPVATQAAVLWYKDISENIWNYVTDKPQLLKEYDHGYRWVKLVSALQFEREGKLMGMCFSGDTEIITDRGTLPLKTLAGQRVNVLAPSGTTLSGTWVAADVEYYGKQALWEIKLARRNSTHILRVTGNHRWLARRNQNKNLNLEVYTTEQLKPGYKIPTLHARNVFTDGSKSVRLSPIGVAHGIAFGDGSCDSASNRYTALPLFGAKDKELLAWFSSKTYRKPFAHSVGGVTLHDLPRYFKELPPIDECASYLAGWLAGYIAADGKVHKCGTPQLDSANLENIKFAETVCQRLGIRVVRTKTAKRVGYKRPGNPGQLRELHSLILEVGSLPADFFLIKAHRDRAVKAAQDVAKWTVKSVKPLGIEEEVYCPNVPETHMFALAGNILTFNCVGNGMYYDRWRKQGTYEYLSLRDGKNQPHVTLEVSYDHSNQMVRKGSIIQCKGKGNRKPDKVYQPYIKRFISDMNFTVSGDSHHID